MINNIKKIELDARIKNHEYDSVETDLFGNNFYIFNSEDIVICSFTSVDELYVVNTRHMSHLFEREWVLDDDETIVTIFIDSNGNEFKIPLEFFTDNF